MTTPPSYGAAPDRPPLRAERAGFGGGFGVRALAETGGGRAGRPGTPGKAPCSGAGDV